MQFAFAQQSYQGTRPENQDNTAVLTRSDAVLLVIADGLGGHKGGALASKTLIDSIRSSFYTASAYQLDHAASFFSLSISQAHRDILEAAEKNGYETTDPKTTCVLCLIRNGIARWAHVGDSRLYFVRSGLSLFITKDHVALSNKGNYFSISRCVGGLYHPEVEISPEIKLQKKDMLFLATDGAWRFLRETDFEHHINFEKPQKSLDQLLKKLEQRCTGACDNLSVTLLIWQQKQTEQPNKNPAHSPINKNNPNKPISVTNKLHEIELFIEELDDNLTD